MSSLKHCLDISKHPWATEEFKTELLAAQAAAIKKGKFTDPKTIGPIVLSESFKAVDADLRKVRKAILAYYDNMVKEAKAAGKPVYDPDAAPSPEKKKTPAKDLLKTVRLREDSPPGHGDAMNEIIERGEADIFGELGYPTDLNSLWFNHEFNLKYLGDIKAGFANINVEGGDQTAWIVKLWTPFEADDLQRRIATLKAFKKRFGKRKEVYIDYDGEPVETQAEGEGAWKKIDIDYTIDKLETIYKWTMEQGAKEKPPRTPKAPQKPELSEKAKQASALADWVAKALEPIADDPSPDYTITWRELFKKADKFFKGTQAQGAYTPRDAYDAMELGVNRYLLQHIQLDIAQRRAQVGGNGYQRIKRVNRLSAHAKQAHPGANRFSAVFYAPLSRLCGQLGSKHWEQ